MLWIVFDLDTPISLLLVICLLVLLFAVSVVGCLLGYSSCLVVWIPLFLDPSDGAFGRFDLAALCGCRTLNFFFVCLYRRFEASDLLPYATRETLEELGLVGYQIDTFSSDYDDYIVLSGFGIL